MATSVINNTVSLPADTIDNSIRARTGKFILNNAQTISEIATIPIGIAQAFIGAQLSALTIASTMSVGVPVLSSILHSKITHVVGVPSFIALIAKNHIAATEISEKAQEFLNASRDTAKKIQETLSKVTQSTMNFLTTNPDYRRAIAVAGIGVCTILNPQSIFKYTIVGTALALAAANSQSILENTSTLFEKIHTNAQNTFEKLTQKTSALYKSLPEVYESIPDASQNIRKLASVTINATLATLTSMTVFTRGMIQETNENQAEIQPWFGNHYGDIERDRDSDIDVSLKMVGIAGVASLAALSVISVIRKLTPQGKQIKQLTLAGPLAVGSMLAGYLMPMSEDVIVAKNSIYKALFISGLAISALAGASFATMYGTREIYLTIEKKVCHLGEYLRPTLDTKTDSNNKLTTQGKGV